MKPIPISEQALVVQRLERELQALHVRRTEAVEALRMAQRHDTLIRTQQEALRKELDELVKARTEPVVSEHALLRWIERVEGVDLDKLRQHILSEPTASSINFAGTGRVEKDGYTLVFKDRIVVTVHANK